MHKIKLSPFAKIFHTEWLLDPNSTRYNVSMDQTLHGYLDVDRLRRALKKFVADHILLNSYIQNINGEPHWVKNENISELEYIDSQVSTIELLNYVSKSFDLYAGPLYRFKLLRISSKAYRFIIVLHHLLVDGASIDEGVFASISNYYNDENFRTKEPINNQLKLITALNELLHTQLEKNKHKHKEFWQAQLSGLEGVDLRFIKLSKSAAEKKLLAASNLVEQYIFSYGESELDKLKFIKQKYSVTPYIYSQCIFALLLYKFSGQEQFAINYPIAIKEGMEFIYGAHININIIPYKFQQTTTILQLLNQSREFFKSTKQEDLKHCYWPITEIVQGAGGNNLLNACFMQTRFRNKSFEFHGITKVEISAALNMDSVSKEMLLFEQELTANELNYRVRYYNNVIDKKLLANFIATYDKLFHDVLNDLVIGDGSKLVFDYDILHTKHYQQIVYDFNKTYIEYSKNQTIHKLFEEQVRKTPHAVAAEYQDYSITYEELNEKVNQLARMMQGRGVNAGNSMVAICMERGLDLLVGLLATIKSGGAYIPLDPNYPSERVKFILAEANVKLVLTQIGILNRSLVLGGVPYGVICLDQDRSYIASFDSANLGSIHQPDDLMYIIYTSGSTGNPKGVQITHANVANFLVGMQQLFPLHYGDKFLASTTITFDIAGLELYLPLVCGAQIVIVDREIVTNPKALLKFISQAKITHMQATPSLWSLLVDAGWEGKSDLTLLSGGEALSQELADVLLTKGKELWNLYGPTETTIWSTAGRVAANRVPHIGKPIANTQIFILDANKKPVPAGVIGELYIGGDGVGRGYLARDELNAKNFIANPFDNTKSTKLYKTNDAARYLIDGNIEYFGRMDYQVKLNGYRIELGEIESVLTSHSRIKHAAVLVMEHKATDRSKFLAAYYTADSEMDGAELESFLAKHLPVYMLPSVFIYLKKFPLTASGKLDRKSLPEVNFADMSKYVVPSNEQECLICREFGKVLGIKQVGVNDDFFKFGGTSLKAIALTTALQANFDIKVADIFNFRTPKKLAENACFGKNVLKQKLEHIKLSYRNKSNKPSFFDDELQGKLERYSAAIDSLLINVSLQKPIGNVLLTGATGYLGCNILNQLLKSTTYKVFLLIRAKSDEEVINKVQKKYYFYFGETLDCVLSSRVFVIRADIEKSNLGLAQKEYHELSEQVDSIIHSAALVKHYGEYDKFYSANVQATINLLELSKQTKLKDFHHVSTYSILNFGFIPNYTGYIYTEDDMPDNLEQWPNVYVQTKLQGEREVIRYRELGINSSIYRVGNLAFISENFCAQENIEDNAFFNWLKCLFKMKCIAEDINLVEISQVDLTAQAIVKLFNIKQSTNSIYHVFNPCLFNLSTVFNENRKIPIKTLSMEQFIDNIVANLNNEIYHDLILKFLLHQGWLDERGLKNTTSIKILQNKTQHVLKQLGFEWAPITNAMFNRYLECLLK